MSSIVKHKTVIKGLNDEMLAEAIKLMSSIKGANVKVSIGDRLTDYWGNRVSCPAKTIVLSIEGNRFPIGVYVQNGQLIMEGDWHGCSVNADMLKKAIQQGYSAAQIKLTLMRRGYKTAVVMDNGKMKVQGAA